MQPTVLEDWFDPIENGHPRPRAGFIQELIEAELEEALSRPRYGRSRRSEDWDVAPGFHGHRRGHRPRTVMGTLRRVEIKVPRARLTAADGKTSEWNSKTLPTYQRRTQTADALIAGTYLAGNQHAPSASCARDAV